MAEIDVSGVDDTTFRVTVTEGASTSSHEVTVDADDLTRLAGGHSAGHLVEASFRFLLDREPKESILAGFDLGVIERYFPEYPNRIGDYL
jgi:hypothetical protein